MTTILRPALLHARDHNRPDVVPGDCWECQRQSAKCRSKRRFPDASAGAAAALEVNIKQGWAWMLAPYGCPWCNSYHLTKTKPGSDRWKRVERRRRKWAASESAVGVR